MSPPPAPAAVPSVAAESKPELSKPQPGKGHAKIAPSLQGLAEKLVNGNFTDGAVKVRDGWVDVFIYLTDDGEEALNALKNLGVRVLAHTASGKMVHARVKAADIEKVAELDFVKRIEPPTF